MKKLLLILAVLFLATPCFAQPVRVDRGEIEEIQKPINEKYSYKDFNNQVFADVDEREFNNTEIIGSCFWQEAGPDTPVFPSRMSGVVFIRCNLNNVLIPNENTVITEGADKSTNKKIKTQNDGEDWIVDDSLKPIAPVNKDRMVAFGVSIDPKDIPTEKMTEAITLKREREMQNEKQALIDAIISE